MASIEPNEIFACSSCHKKFHADGFKVSRLGIRNKSCIECAIRRKEIPRNPAKKCPHGRQKSRCQECEGCGFCEHNRIKKSCIECKGSCVCEHKTNRGQCKFCNVDGHLKQAITRRAKQVINEKITNETAMNYIGCDIQTFKNHIEAQFTEGMTWNNHTSDGWHVDHIIPLTHGSPSIDEIIKRLHYSNTQPLWATDNIKKGNRIIGQVEKIKCLECNKGQLPQNLHEELCACCYVSKKEYERRLDNA